MTDLDELEIDALTEVFNVGVGYAADALHQLLDQHIPLSVPQVELSGLKRAQQQFLLRETRNLCLVRQAYSGVFTTDALLVFAETDSLQLVRLMTGGDVSEDELSGLRQDALAELGNIVLNAVMSNLSASLGLTFEGSLPEVRYVAAHALFDHVSLPGEASIRIDTAGDCVLALMVDFALSAQHIQAHLAFLLDASSTRLLRQQLALSL